MRISLIGSGNVATHIGAALKNAGHSIGRVWSRNPEHAALLAYHLKATPAGTAAETVADADLLIISVSDDAIPGIVRQFRTGCPVVHTSGSTSMNVLASCSDVFGVIYPLQTFSKHREVDFRQVPIAVEGSSEEVVNLLKKLVSGLSDHVSVADSEKRLALHVAAVFAGNFSNHLYRLAERILSAHGMDFDMLRPLILETAAKAAAAGPGNSQTGPAVRNDRAILEKHFVFLENEPELASIYHLLSQQIINFKA
jgi:predicted short-subunit dehydrogenase-like oxidoreductase (DUF2520 family)